LLIEKLKSRRILSEMAIAFSVVRPGRQTLSICFVFWLEQPAKYARVHAQKNNLYKLIFVSLFGIKKLYKPQ